ncbi:MAG: metallophosphoesterase [Clostridia bacterium]|nr:metallophosphoesterase [Clostridia bacterium]
MSLYALGDLHLHFQAELKSPAQMQGVWRNHEEKFRRHCETLIGKDDTLLLLGDHSWGRTIGECELDFRYIQALPGHKILLRGNHDMFWDVKKTDALSRRFEGRLQFLQNNYQVYHAKDGDVALVGTKGYTFEGPFYLNRSGRITGWDEDAEAHAQKLVAREAERLEISFQKAIADGYRRFIMLLHYPPTNILERESIFTRMAEKYCAEQVIYAHCHGETRFHDSLEGTFHGIEYHLASGDYLKWKPLKVMD